MTTAPSPVLRGVSWDHPRGMAPLQATAAAWRDAAVEWRPRTLQAFADQSIADLAAEYDLLVIDHPWAGTLSVEGTVLALDEHLPAEVLDDLAAGSVGASHRSYAYRGHQWALAIDAAAQVAACRPDLLERAGAPVPTTWAAVLDLGERLRGDGRGALGLPLIPVDALMSFLSICVSLGAEPFAGRDAVVPRPVGREALELLGRLRDLAHPEAARENPIRVLDRMSTSDDVAYCPLTFGYTNYARAGFRPQVLRFVDAPAHADGPPCSVLGGTGIAVSARCRHPELAVAYAAHVAGADVQRGVYVTAGGQPAHRAAWTDPAADALCGGFFTDTVATLEAAWLRPRYDGFLTVQDEGGDAVHAHLFGRLRADDVLDRLDELHAAGIAAARA